MKEYRLVAWPQLRAPFDRIAYTRMLSDMSHRHMSLAQLTACSGVRRRDVRSFLEMLDERHLLAEREITPVDSLFGSLKPLRKWLRGSLAAPRKDR